MCFKILYNDIILYTFFRTLPFPFNFGFEIFFYIDIYVDLFIFNFGIVFHYMN